MRMIVAGICAAALLVGPVARPAEAAVQPRGTTRQFHRRRGPVSGAIDVRRKPPGARPFHATFPALAYTTVPDLSCQGGRAIVLTGALQRPGIPDWSFSTHGCPTVRSATMRITTGGGITIDGTFASQPSSGTVFRFAFDLVRASREYSAGHIDLTIDAEVPGASGSATGQFIVKA